MNLLTGCIPQQGSRKPNTGILGGASVTDINHLYDGDFTDAISVWNKRNNISRNSDHLSRTNTYKYNIERTVYTSFVEISNENIAGEILTRYKG